jgi:hypothetical protein
VHVPFERGRGTGNQKHSNQQKNGTTTRSVFRPQARQSPMVHFCSALDVVWPSRLARDGPHTTRVDLADLPLSAKISNPVGFYKMVMSQR